MVWKSEKFTMYDTSDRPVAVVAKVARGWCWYIIGADHSGDADTATDAMAAAEKACGTHGTVADATGIKWVNL